MPLISKELSPHFGKCICSLCCRELTLNEKIDATLADSSRAPSDGNRSNYLKVMFKNVQIGEALKFSHHKIQLYNFLVLTGMVILK